MRRMLPSILSAAVALSAAGCWDANNVVNQKIINGISLDAVDKKDGKDNANGSIHGTVRALRLESKGGGQFEVKDELVQTDGRSTLEVGAKLDSMLAGNIVGSKIHILIVGEELAKQGLYTLLEPFYRSPRLYLGAKILISQGNAAEILSFDKLEKSPISFDILQMIQGAERATYIPKQTLYTLWNRLFDPGHDAIVPIINLKKPKDLVTNGVGLFRGDRFTGEMLFRGDSMLLLLLMGRLSRLAQMQVDIGPRASIGDGGQVVTYNVKRTKRSLKVRVDEQSKEIDCDITLHLYGEIVSASSVSAEQSKARLTEALASSINDQARMVVAKLLKARCDAFGIGDELAARHPSLWQSLDWSEAYPDVRIKPEVIVHITGMGALK